MEDKTNDFRGGAAFKKNDAETEAADKPAQRTACAAEAGGEEPPKFSEGLKKALVRCGVALAIAIVLLAATRFSIASIIKGPAQTTAITSEKNGAYIRRDIYAVVGYSDSEKSGETVVGEYALVPMDGKFVTVHLPRRFLSSADAVYEETKSYLSDSSASTLDKYFVVDGTVGTLTDAQKKKLSDWYTANKDWLVKNHVIDDTVDGSAYLSNTILEVDQIGGMSQITVIVLSAVAGIFLVYVIVELILMACGFYLDDRIKARLAKANAALAGKTTEEILEDVAAAENGDTSESASADEIASGENAASTETEDNAQSEEKE